MPFMQIYKTGYLIEGKSLWGKENKIEAKHGSVPQSLWSTIADTQGLKKAKGEKKKKSALQSIPGGGKSMYKVCKDQLWDIKW